MCCDHLPLPRCPQMGSHFFNPHLFRGEIAAITQATTSGHSWGQSVRSHRPVQFSLLVWNCTTWVSIYHAACFGSRWVCHSNISYPSELFWVIAWCCLVLKHWKSGQLLPINPVVHVLMSSTYPFWGLMCLNQEDLHNVIYCWSQIGCYSSSVRSANSSN